MIDKKINLINCLIKKVLFACSAIFFGLSQPFFFSRAPRRIALLSCAERDRDGVRG